MSHWFLQQCGKWNRSHWMPASSRSHWEVTSSSNSTTPPHVREFSRCPICRTPSSFLYTEMCRTCSSLLCEFIVIQCDRVFFQTWSGIAHQMNNLFKGVAATRAAGGKSTVPALLSWGAQTWMPGPLISLRCHYVLLLNFYLARWDLPVVITTECQHQTAACRRLIICVLEKPSSLAVPRVNSGSMSVTLWLSVTYSTRRGEVAKSKPLTQLRVKVDETALNQKAVKFLRIFLFWQTKQKYPVQFHCTPISKDEENYVQAGFTVMSILSSDVCKEQPEFSITTKKTFSVPDLIHLSQTLCCWYLSDIQISNR